MKTLRSQSITIFLFFASQTLGLLPKFIEKDGRHALLVAGKPFLILGGRAHHSSAWPVLLPDVFKSIDFMNANTLEVPLYWNSNKV